MRHQVDPAALLVAVFAVGAGPLLQSGLWNHINTISAGVVLLVVVVFTWPLSGVRVRAGLSWLTLVAYAAVYSFVIAIGAAWPAQQLATASLQQPACGKPIEATTVLDHLKSWDCINENENQLASLGTSGGMQAGGQRSAQQRAGVIPTPRGRHYG